MCSRFLNATKKKNAYGFKEVRSNVRRATLGDCGVLGAGRHELSDSPVILSGDSQTSSPSVTALLHGLNPVVCWFPGKVAISQDWVSGSNGLIKAQTLDLEGQLVRSH